MSTEFSLIDTKKGTATFCIGNCAIPTDGFMHDFDDLPAAQTPFITVGDDVYCGDCGLPTHSPSPYICDSPPRINRSVEAGRVLFSPLPSSRSLYTYSKMLGLKNREGANSLTVGEAKGVYDDCEELYIEAKQFYDSSKKIWQEIKAGEIEKSKLADTSYTEMDEEEKDIVSILARVSDRKIV